jgi:signal transduction histidine kinase
MVQRFFRIRGEEVLVVKTPAWTSSFCRDAQGDTWWGTRGGIYRQRGLSFEYFPEPASMGLEDWMWEVIADDERGGLWVSVGDQGLVHFKDGVWSKEIPPPPGLLQRGPSATFRDPRGRTWFGYTENRAALLDGGRAKLYTSADGIDVGRIRVIRGRGAHTWLGGELGLALFRDGRFRSVIAKNGERFGTVTGLIETADGALWLNEMRGVIRLAPREVQRIVENSAYRAEIQIFDFADGLRGSPQMNWTVSTAAETTDGRLWFATDNGLVWIDPRKMSFNKIPPTVIIQSLEGDRHYRAAPGIVLPPGTQRVHLRYTATSLSIPERVAFRYKLEGVDEQWQDAGSRREAFYNRLAPGDYTFQVMASNNDGVWSDPGTRLRFRVQPAWYQTNAFRVACAMLAFLAIWALHRLRVRQVEAAAAARFDERLAERTRLAREMHDTLLQTIQGSKMVADDALGGPDDSARMRTAIQQLSAWLGRAVAEGRAALHSLRTSTTEGNDLLEAMKHATESELIPRSMSVTCSASGERREMHPIVRDEIYRIGYEAILNASAHSGASRLSIELEYAQDFSLRVMDNGAGIEPNVAAHGKSGHFGLQGMRERAARIEGHLTIVSSIGSGTTISLVVPGGIAFRKDGARVL